jgi:hypothetical protein
MPSVPDRDCPRWQRLRQAVGPTADDIDPDEIADRVWADLHDRTGPAGSHLQVNASRARQEKE